MGGGRKRGRTQRRHFKQSRENVWRHDPKKTRPDEAPLDNPSNLNPSSNPSWEPFVSRNPGFEEYYKEQRIVPEDEWEEFLCLLRKPLPAAFRINASGQFSQDIRSQMENDFVKSLESEVDSEYEVEAIRPLLWYPDNLAWHLNFSRMQLRKNQTLERFHEFLKQENEVGNITRQEAVSMVPPLFLDVLPDHYILDMCAAPGSKTFQLLEIIHQRINPGLLPNGLVIANDVDVQRCNLLIHQTKRMCSANLIVTNHEAQHFPSCSLAMDCLNTSKGGQDQMQKSILQFDRVLCDVPCSGDGTLRKAPDIWRKWNAGMGNGLHRLQVEIAMRGIALLKVGGRMVYSTCSMNPVENEAVVAEVLRRSGGSIQLLDVSSELPELVRRPGLKIWKVRDKGIWLTSYQDVPTYRRGVIVPSMFPFDQSSEEAEIVCHGVQESLVTLDSDTGIGKSVNLEKTPQDISRTEQESNCENMEGNCTMADIRKAASESEEIPQKISCVDNLGCQMEVSSVPLERCMRILPHDQNSGAFFIAVLQKLSALQENYMGGPTNNRCMNKESLCESLEDEQKLEITPFEDIPSHNHVILPEAASDTNLVGDQASTKSTEVGQPVHFNNVNSKDDESKEVEVSDNQAKKGAKGKLQIRGKWKGVDPVVFFKDETTINSIRSFYGISESFVLDGRLVSRNNDANHVKRIYYISKSVHDILQLNFQVGQRLKITSLGLKIFERQTAKDSSSPCVFRLSSEGLPLLLPYISRQILFASLADFRHLLQYRTIKFGDFVNAEFGDKASKLMSGCCVVVLNEGDRTTDNILLDGSTIAIVCWKGKTNISVMVSQMDGQELLERLSIRFGLLRGTLGEGHKDTSSEVDGIKDPEGIEQMEYSETADRQTVCQAE